MFLRGKVHIKEFKRIEARKHTFNLLNIAKNDFGVKDEKKKEELAYRVAEAGFYFFGHNTILGCFSCGLSLAFEQSMDPWYIHAILSSKCKFLVQPKGQEFVKSIQIVRKYGMPADTVVTFMWRVFGSNQKIEIIEPIYRPCSNIALRLKEEAALRHILRNK